MQEKEIRQLCAMIGGFAEMYDRPKVSPTALALWAKALGDYPIAKIEKAFHTHAKGCKFMPRPADIIEILDAAGDGRPSADEAWLQMPRSEGASIVWTEEMCEAYAPIAATRHLDEIAARMAFKAAYTRLCDMAKGEGRPARWFFSPGRDPSDREPVLNAAVAKGRIPASYAQKNLPAPAVSVETLLLAAPELVKKDDSHVREFIAAFTKRATTVSGVRR